MLIRLDLETRSPLNLARVGHYKYAENAELVCAAWAIDDGPVRGALCVGKPLPAELWELIEGSDAPIEAHNAAFERAMLWALARRGHAPRVALSRWHCTMAQAYRINLPGGLDEVAARLGVSSRKDMRGKADMLAVSVGVEVPSDLLHDQAYVHYNENPDILRRVLAYCRQDVVVERAISKRLPAMSRAERAVWLADQRINARGFAVDGAYCERARELGERAVSAWHSSARRVTGGIAPTQKQRYLAWLATEHGVKLDSAGHAVIERALAAGVDLPREAREALELLAPRGMLPLKKYDRMLEARCADGRIRGSLQYGQGTTLRWTGKGAQPHNFPSRLKCPTLAADPQAAYQDVLRLSLAEIEAAHGSAAVFLAMCLRGAITHADTARGAENPRVLLVADFSSLEPRILAWLANDHAFLLMVRAGGDPYLDMAARLFGVAREGLAADTTVHGLKVRDIGKLAVNGLGYGMAAGAFTAHLADLAPGMDYDDLAPVRRALVPADLAGKYDKRERKLIDEGALPAWAMIASRIVDIYRETREPVVKFWHGEEKCAKACVRDGGTAGAWRMMRVAGLPYLGRALPSGRFFYYPEPELEGRNLFWKTPTGAPGTIHGGQIAADATQAVGRDLLADLLVRIERCELRGVLHVHDEPVVEEVRASDEQTLHALANEGPRWAQGLPISADVVRMERYSK